jgi:hypothetical protein
LEECIDESGVKLLGIVRGAVKTERDAVFLGHMPEKGRLLLDGRRDKLMRLDVLSVDLRNPIRGFRFLEQSSVADSLVPLHHSKLRKQRIIAEAQADEQIRIEATIRKIFDNTRTPAKKPISISPNDKNIVSTKPELLYGFVLDICVFQAASWNNFPSANSTDA